MKKFNFCLIAILLSIAWSADVFSGVKYMSLGTGEVTGLYYVTGGNFSRFFNQSKESDIGFSAEITKGSVYNINAVLEGKLDFGLAQSDCQYQAYHGTSGSPWGEKGPRKRLRTIFYLYPESVTLITPVRTQIMTVKDLVGLKINLGGMESGPLQNARDILASYGLSEAMAQPKYLKMCKAISFMREGGVSALFYTVGHPSKIIEIASQGYLKTRLVEISGHEIAALIEKNPYYMKTTIPISLYPNFANKTDVKTVGVRAALFTSADMDADMVYAITKEMFENLERFKRLNQAYKKLTRQKMTKGFAAPFHEGALRYYKEVGLIKKQGVQKAAPKEKSLHISE